MVYPLDWSLESSPAAVVLRLRGEVDLSTVSIFRQALHSAAEVGLHVILDFAGITYVDAGGFRAIKDVRAREVQKQGRQLVLAAPSALIRRIIQLLELDVLLFPSVDAALRALSHTQDVGRDV